VSGKEWKTQKPHKMLGVTNKGREQTTEKAEPAVPKKKKPFKIRGKIGGGFKNLGLERKKKKTGGEKE